MSEMTREEAINELTEALMEINPNDLGREEILRWAVALNMAIEALKGERPHGEWATTPNPNHSPFDSTSEVIYMCSKCAYSSGDRITATWNFCPNCGAEMKGGEAE